MDKFEKATAVYIVLVIAFISLRIVSTHAILGAILAHLVYLKFATDDIVETNASSLWKPAFVFIGIPVALIYAIQRK